MQKMAHSASLHSTVAQCNSEEQLEEAASPQVTFSHDGESVRGSVSVAPVAGAVGERTNLDHGLHRQAATSLSQSGGDPSWGPQLNPDISPVPNGWPRGPEDQSSSSLDPVNSGADVDRFSKSWSEGNPHVKIVSKRGVDVGRVAHGQGQVRHFRT